MKVNMILFVFALLTCSINAQNSQELLEQMQKKFEEVGSFSTDFSADFVLPGQGKRKTNGKFDYSPVDKYRLELQGIVISSDGEITRTYQQKTNKVIINYTSEYPNSLSLNKYLYEYPKQCNLSFVELEDLKGVKFIPKDSELEFESAEIYVDSKLIIKKMIITDYQGMVYTVRMKNLQASKTFSASHFKYEGSKGVKVIDLR